MEKIFSKLDRYILRKFIGTFVVSILLILFIVIVFDISEKIEDFVNHKVALKEIVFDYYLNFIPYIVNLFSPLFTFIAVIFFTSRLASRTEIVAMLSSGISFNRLLRPYLVGATLIAGTSLFLNNYLIPRANKTRLDFESKYVGSQYVFDGKNIHREVDKDIYVYMETYNSTENVGTRFTLEKMKGLDLVFKLTAREIKWDSIRNRWSIIDYYGRYIDGRKEYFVKGDRIDTTLNLTPKDFGRTDNVIKSMTAGELNRFIDDEKKKGSDSVQIYEIEKHSRIAYPFATFILTLIGVSVSSRKTRGGIGMHLGIGLGLSFGFIFFMQLFTSYAQSGVIPAYIAVWIPNIIFAAVAIFMLRKAPK
ncbi:MAG TPA: LptF/LptG family permease [Bacteroidia bacterium]|nr:LptF/LptG family permease [Bacteroidia bacterium]